MAQFGANRPLVEDYAQQARQAGFWDSLLYCPTRWIPCARRRIWPPTRGPTASGTGRGFGGTDPGLRLGVMNARAAYFAKQDPRFRAFLLDGRAYGPHGQGAGDRQLLSHYDDGLPGADGAGGHRQSADPGAGLQAPCGSCHFLRRHAAAADAPPELALQLGGSGGSGSASATV